MVIVRLGWGGYSVIDSGLGSTVTVFVGFCARWWCGGIRDASGKGVGCGRAFDGFRTAGREVSTRGPGTTLDLGIHFMRVLSYC
jgi:hypothetical protein